ncbi:SAM-dependent MidA family methyltransferase [Anoxybacillus voinovskiensis]|uniref:SAM-dependent MidA family methyltransferase n=1 Tax=Anoxybacteroides voinovskiense TaxID=230470 RepID=A0A840DKC4_9BACL|nr:SAM-dependent methyltransferase [Anoxybacillus voinovskiensis]MBB4073524.1 SAM-dependent MidA family methyltransferase [Anoxybacillus voinovskiensis]GGJ62689.1 SAM-dependent methyltransferase [Anoxybacillus voinovskiensis]
MNFIVEAIMSSPNQRISYADYMNLALYDEKNGYYMKDRDKIGRTGDFYTSIYVSDVFGKLFASLFIKLVEAGKIPPCICELGGGDGKFARAVLTEWKQASATFEQLTYMIVDTSPYQRKKQQQALADFHQHVISYEGLDDFRKQRSSFSGIVFSNEFFDALPVHVITRERGELYELFVTVTDGRLQEEKQPLENEAILAYLRERKIELLEGQRLEVPLAMKAFLFDHASFFDRCVMFTVDYGYTDDEWKQAGRREGSLRGYYQHRLIANPLAYPGEMDITSHIPWDALRLYGEQAGWEWVDTIRQDRFLLAAGILDYLVAHHDPNPFSEQSRRNRAIRSLIIDEGISSAFHVMIQQKGVHVDWDAMWKEPQFLK